jgi:serine/threonine-protein kinase
MKHVREGIPDVQMRRPEISATLAAAVERATAKDVAARYPSVAEMVRELEEVLAIEAARGGAAEGEATAVLERLPAEVTGRPAGRRGRGRLLAFALGLLVIAVGAGVLIERSGDDGPTATQAQDLSTIRLGSGRALDYDPPPGDGQENPAALALALDGDRSTTWQTERYDSAELGNIKDGVGLYLDAGRPVVARALRVVTPLEGWDLELNVANEVPDTVADWTTVGSGTMDASAKTFNLDTGSQRFRYYLVWVTRLAEDPNGRFGAAISELRLLG